MAKTPPLELSGLGTILGKTGKTAPHTEDGPPQNQGLEDEPPQNQGLDTRLDTRQNGQNGS